MMDGAGDNDSDDRDDRDEGAEPRPQAAENEAPDPAAAADNFDWKAHGSELLKIYRQHNAGSPNPPSADGELDDDDLSSLNAKKEQWWRTAMHQYGAADDKGMCFAQALYWFVDMVNGDEAQMFRWITLIQTSSILSLLVNFVDVCLRDEEALWPILSSLGDPLFTLFSVCGESWPHRLLTAKEQGLFWRCIRLRTDYFLGSPPGEDVALCANALRDGFLTVDPASYPKSMALSFKLLELLTCRGDLTGASSASSASSALSAPALARTLLALHSMPASFKGEAGHTVAHSHLLECMSADFPFAIYLFRRFSALIAEPLAGPLSGSLFQKELDECRAMVAAISPVLADGAAHMMAPLSACLAESAAKEAMHIGLFRDWRNSVGSTAVWAMRRDRELFQHLCSPQQSDVLSTPAVIAALLVTLQPAARANLFPCFANFYETAASDGAEDEAKLLRTLGLVLASDPVLALTLLTKPFVSPRTSLSGPSQPLHTPSTRILALGKWWFVHLPKLAVQPTPHGTSLHSAAPRVPPTVLSGAALRKLKLLLEAAQVAAEAASTQDWRPLLGYLWLLAAIKVHLVGPSALVPIAKVPAHAKVLARYHAATKEFRTELRAFVAMLTEHSALMGAAVSTSWAILMSRCTVRDSAKDTPLQARRQAGSDHRISQWQQSVFLLTARAPSCHQLLLPFFSNNVFKYPKPYHPISISGEISKYEAEVFATFQSNPLLFDCVSSLLKTSMLVKQHRHLVEAIVVSSMRSCSRYQSLGKAKVTSLELLAVRFISTVLGNIVKDNRRRRKPVVPQLAQLHNTAQVSFPACTSWNPCSSADNGDSSSASRLPAPQLLLQFLRECLECLFAPAAHAYSSHGEQAHHSPAILQLLFTSADAIASLPTMLKK